MEELKALFEEIFHIDLVQAVWSNPRGGEIQKVKVRPVELKGSLYFQFESFTKTQVFHKNLEADAAAQEMCVLAQQFKQLQMVTLQEEYSVLISKKGKVTVRKKKRDKVAQQAKNYAHNKAKNYILQEGTAVPFLIDLGVMTREGRIVSAKSDKFRQMNRFLEFIEDILPQLAKTVSLRSLISDVGNLI